MEKSHQSGIIRWYQFKDCLLIEHLVPIHSMRSTYLLATYHLIPQYDLKLTSKVFTQDFIILNWYDNDNDNDDYGASRIEPNIDNTIEKKILCNQYKTS